MAELKTKKTKASASAFIDAIPDEERREDCRKLAALMKKAAGAEGKMWGANIVGFGEHTIRYDSGRELDWMMIGFSPRKGPLTLYGLGVNDQPELLAKLGKHKTGKGCLYVNRLSDVDTKVLEKMAAASVKAMKARAKA
jgi:hypothetical protein